MKARKAVTRTGHGFRAYVVSKKLQRMVEAESLVERDAIMLFEYSRGVIRFQEQPELIMYESEGKMHRYYPDFEVELKNGEIIHFEIKPLSKLSNPKIIKKLTAITQHYLRTGRNFRILTDAQIRKEPLLTNLKYLTRFQFYSKDITNLRSKVDKSIMCEPASTIQSLSVNYGLTNVLVLISRGYLICNLDLDLLAEHNHVRLPKENDDDALFF